MSNHYQQKQHETFFKNHKKTGLLSKLPESASFFLQRMSDSELIFILLNSKTRNIKKVINKIRETIALHSELSDPALFLQIEGMSQDNALRLSAAFELARRKINPRHRKVNNADEVFILLQSYAHLLQEHFIVISLNGASEVNAVRVITVGLVNRTQVHPREVFADALMERATSVILAHNHPSGNLQPSQEDILITKRLVNAGDLLGIQVLDHLIFSSQGYFSFEQEGIMPLA